MSHPARRLRIANTFLLLWVVTNAAPGAADEAKDVSRDATAHVMRAHVATGASEPPARKQLKQELSETHQLIEMALRDVVEGRGEATIALVRAQLIRLRPLVDAQAKAAGGGPTEFTAIADALTALEAGFSTLGARSALAESPAGARQLLERLEARSGPGASHLDPTVTLSNRQPIVLGE